MPHHSILRSAPAAPDEDHAALEAASLPGTGLCTLVGIDGSFSRRLGAQLAISPDGTFAGSLADGCLEAQLKADCLAARGPTVRRYGRGSDNVDFRLPCGGGLDILVDPAPNTFACAAALRTLQERRETYLDLPIASGPSQRHYIPRLMLRIFGAGPEVEALRAVGAAAGIACETIPPTSLSLGRASGLPTADRWTAVVLLFHDHEWEAALIEEALASEAFYVGAQGGYPAREARAAELARRGVAADAIARMKSPIGVSAGSRSPQNLALSILAEITEHYERLRPQP